MVPPHELDHAFGVLEQPEARVNGYHRGVGGGANDSKAPHLGKREFGLLEVGGLAVEGHEHPEGGDVGCHVALQHHAEPLGGQLDEVSLAAGVDEGVEDVEAHVGAQSGLHFGN